MRTKKLFGARIKIRWEGQLVDPPNQHLTFFVGPPEQDNFLTTFFVLYFITVIIGVIKKYPLLKYNT